MVEVGSSIVTADGINALANASASGTRVRPKYFKFSDKDVMLDPNLSASDITGWRTQDISLYQKIDDKTVEFVCDVIPTEATHYTRCCGLFLEDGTLFMVAKPPFPFPPSLRQTFKIQMVYENVQGLMDFKYVSFDENEKRIGILEEVNNQPWHHISNTGTYLTTLKTSSANATQGVCVDRKTNEVFSVQLTGGNVRLSRFSELVMCGHMDATWSVDLNLPDSHQSLAIVYYNNQRWFVMNGDTQGHIVLFRADSSGLIEQRTVRTHNNIVSNYCTAGANPAMTHLVVEGVENQDIQTVKIFSIKDVFEWSDVSGRALLQFDFDFLPSPPYPLQSLTIDDNLNTYIAFGGGDKEYDNFVRVYDKKGNLIQQETITLGIDATDKYEQEGIFWLYPNGVPILGINVLTGADGANISKLYCLSENIHLPYEKWIDIANPPQDYLHNDSTVLGVSAGLTLDRLYMSFHRLSKNIAQFNVRVEVSGFTADLPNDATTNVLIDFNAINRDYGLFRGIKGGSVGACTIEYGGDSFDVTPAAGVILIQNKAKTVNPNTVAFYVNDYQTQEAAGITRMIGNAQITIRVE